MVQQTIFVGLGTVQVLNLFPLALDANLPMMPICKGVHFNGILITYQIN